MRRPTLVLLVVVAVVGAVAGAVAVDEMLKRTRRTSELQRVSAARIQRDEHADRILDWIVLRNPEATIRDFTGVPRLLLEQAEAAGIDYRVVLALIDKESHFNPKAVGSSGEVGLMQVMPATAAIVAKGLGIQFEPPTPDRTGAKRYSNLGTLGDTRANVRIGIAYLKDQVEKFGMSPTALRAYNRGESNATQHRPHDRYAEDIGLRLVRLVQEFPR